MYNVNNIISEDAKYVNGDNTKNLLCPTYIEN